MLEDLENAPNRIVGLKQLIRELDTDNVECIYMADDAEVHVKGKVRKALAGRDIEVVAVDSMERLGKSCGINVGAACAAILKKEQAKR